MLLVCDCITTRRLGSSQELDQASRNRAQWESAGPDILCSQTKIGLPVDPRPSPLNVRERCCAPGTCVLRCLPCSDPRTDARDCATPAPRTSQYRVSVPPRVCTIFRPQQIDVAGDSVPPRCAALGRGGDCSPAGDTDHADTCRSW